jgi:hypothetical protein
MVGLPTRSQIEAWPVATLSALAAAWQREATATEGAYSAAVKALGGVPWTGSAAEAARDAMFGDLVKVRAAADTLREAAQLARDGADLLARAQRDALSAIAGAERQLFSVSESLAVADRLPWGFLSIPQKLLRALLAKVLQADVHAEALTLATDDEQVAARLTPLAAQLAEFTLDGHGDSPGDPSSPGGPTIDAGSRTDPKFERDDFDLGCTIPGTGIFIGGDGKDGRPTLDIPGQDPGDNPLSGVPDGYRPLPTGTAVVPDGKQYAFYSIQPYQNKDGTATYVAAESTVVDLADPTESVGTLKDSVTGTGISQASGVYDPKSNTMVIVGNIGADGKRAMWQSAPINPGDPPNRWMSNLKQLGTFDHLGKGNRENQIVALPQGGFLLTSAGNGEPVYGVAGATPQDLLTATRQQLTPNIIPGNDGYPPGIPYGPTITDVTYNPATGKEEVHMRVSTWTGGRADYNPKTYTTTFTVTP